VAVLVACAQQNNLGTATISDFNEGKAFGGCNACGFFVDTKCNYILYRYRHIYIGVLTV
jgi:hypothetical protein